MMISCALWKLFLNVAMMRRSGARVTGTLQKKPGNNPRLSLLRPFEGLYSVYGGREDST